MKMTMKRFGISGCLLVVGLAVHAAPRAARERDDQQPNAQITPSASMLQVSGGADRITITASHADVLNALSLVLTQAHRQFVPDGGLSGEVTLSLTDQPLNLVLDAIDRQAYLRYEVDARGIYQFSRDEAALQAAFIRLRAINSFLREQLSRMGYALPPAPQSLQAGRGAPGGGAGGLGGGTHDNDNVTGAPQNNGGSLRPKSPTGVSAGAGTSQPPQPDAPLTPYEQTLRANGLVGVHATREQPVPIVDVLKQFSRESGVPILIDPGIPNGPRFRFYGNIVRPLPDALNLLTSVGQLEWRQVGGQIFITTAPGFGIFYGDSTVPRAVYPPDPQRLPQKKTSVQGG